MGLLHKDFIFDMDGGKMLDVRYGVVPAAVAESVNAIEQLDVLRALRRKSAVVQSLEEFKTALAQAIEK